MATYGGCALSILASVYAYADRRCLGDDERGLYIGAALNQLTKAQQEAFFAEADIIDDYINKTGSYDFEYSDFEPIFTERGLEPQEIPKFK